MKDKQVLLFKVLVIGAICWDVVACLLPLLIDDLPLALKTTRGIETMSIGELAAIDRGFVSLVLALPQLLWIYALIALLNVSRIFEQGVFFSLAITKEIQQFGFRILLMGLLEPWIAIPIGVFLHAKGYFEALQFEWWNLAGFLSTLDMLVASLFVMLMARIMQKAVEIDVEHSLTI